MLEIVEKGPDVVFEIERDHEGRIIKLSYTVNDAGTDCKRVGEAAELMTALFRSESPYEEKEDR